jgi:pyruvate/2-oxoacid:ferredoxin oxidoreductase beta subunit
MSNPTLTAKDFASDNEVRWCPGCGDYSILKQLQMTLAKTGSIPHKTAIISGIGCSSRLPYYMKTYGFHYSLSFELNLCVRVCVCVCVFVEFGVDVL